MVWTAALSSVDLAPSLAAAEPTSLVPRRVFFDNPDYINVRVSPDGRLLAWLAPVNRVNNLFVAPIADPAASRAVTRVTGRSLPNFFAWAYTSRHLVFFRDRDGDENLRAYSVDIENGAVVPLTPDDGVKSFLQETDRKFPEEMLIRHNQRDKSRFDLFRVNIVTGTSELIFENTEYVRPVHRQPLSVAAGDALRPKAPPRSLSGRPMAAWTPFAEVPIGDIDPSAHRFQRRRQRRFT